MRSEILWLLLGMAGVTFLPRFLPMVLLTRIKIPDPVKISLDYIPVSILSAIVFPLLLSKGDGRMGIDPRILLSGLPVFFFAYRLKSLWGSVILGMGLYWGLGHIL